MRLEATLRRFVEHPKKQLLVIIVTTVILLAFGWPAVDEYSAINDRCANLESSLETTLATTSKLHDYEALLQRQLEASATLEERLMTEQRVEQLRSEVEQLVRQAECRMRRIRLSDARERPWQRDDDVLGTRPVADKTKTTPFVLRTRQFSLSVSGPMANVSQLLAELSKRSYLVHAAGFSMQKSEESDDMVVLELELVLIELDKTAPKRPAA